MQRWTLPVDTAKTLSPVYPVAPLAEALPFSDSADQAVERWHQLGRQRQLAGDLEAAELAYQRALAIDPTYLRSLNNLAVLAMGRFEPDAAEAWLQRGLAAVCSWADPAAPLLLNSLCQLRLQQQRPAEALAVTRQLVQLAPEPGSWSNLAVALKWCCQPQQARRAQALALGSPPLDPLQSLWQPAGDAHASASHHVRLLNLATMELGLDPWGRRGWQLLEARLACQAGHWQPELAPPPWSGLWTGEPVPELLVWDEQGYGDAIQALRWLPAVAQCCRQLRLWMRPELEPLVRRRLPLPPHCRIELLRGDAAPWKQGLPHRPLMSLPLALGLKGPAMVEGVGLQRFAAPPRQGARPLRLGLVWAAGRKAEVEADRHARSRSLPLAALMAELAPLVQAGQLRLQAVQVGSDAAQAAGFRGLLEPTPPLADWEATAALLEQLDGLISVDTAVAHLGGSLGLPTLLLLDDPCDWRWGPSGNGTPWYRCVRLLRRRGENWRMELREAASQWGALVGTIAGWP